MATAKKSKKAADAAEQPKLQLSELRPPRGSKKDSLRVGRGRASGAGKTCNRGHNGEGQRAGLSRKRGFEGGQMPLYRRLPHIDGFELINRRQWLEYNVQDLARLLPVEETEFTYDRLTELKLFNPNRYDGIRLLGKGELKRKVVIEAHYATPSAAEKIKAAGGDVKLQAPACA